MSALALAKIGDVQITLSPDSIAERDVALASASSIKAVTDDIAQHSCVETIRVLKQITKSVEESRKAVKAPVLDLGRKIDDMATFFMAGVDSETRRLSKLLSDYQAEQQRKAQEAERLRQAELQRQERERQRIAEEERKAKEAARLAEEEAQRKAEAEFLAPSPAEAEAARKAAEAAQKLADEGAAKLAKSKQEAAAAEALRISTASTVVKAVKPAGVSVATVWKFEVTDLTALVKAHPELCRIEANTAAINKQLSAGKREIPGLRIWSEVAANVR